MKELFFIYGSLKSNEHNNYILNKDNCKFLYKTHSVESVLMFNTPYNYPYLSKNNISFIGQSVVGEVWEIDKQFIDTLDNFEGCPEFYYKDKITVFNPIDKSTIICNCYFTNQNHLNKLDNKFRTPIREWSFEPNNF